MAEIPPRPRWQDALAGASPDAEALAADAGLRGAAGQGSRAAHAAFPLRVPAGYLALADPGDPDDPILKQVLPHPDELRSVPGFTADAVGDLDHHPAPGLVHKYAGRALLVLTGACAVNCRFCFRRAYPYDELRADGLGPALDALEADPSVQEVILSGGDPLTLPDAALFRILDRLEAMPHLRRLRIHSRMPVVLPERITPELVGRLGSGRLSPWIVTHFNHPRELREEATSACRRLIEAGIPVLNQAVLLRGVNDDEDTLVTLFEGLVNEGIQPYYLHQLDRVTGTAHFEVPEARGRALYAGIQARLSGIALPRWVRDVPGAASKLPLAALIVALVGCSASEPEPVRSGLEGVVAADVVTPTPTPRPAPTPVRQSTELPEGLAPLGSADHVLVADLTGSGEPIVFVNAGKDLRWGSWPDEAAAPRQRGQYTGQGVLQSWLAHDLDGDGAEEVVAAFGVGRGAADAPLEVVLLDRVGKSVFARPLWTRRGERNQVTSLAPWPRSDGTFDVYAAAYSSRFEVGGFLISRDGGPAIPLEGHTVRMGSERAVGDFDGDGKADVAIGRMYGESADAPGDLRVLRGDGTVESVPTLRGVRAVGAGDLDGDGRPELLFGDGWHKNYGKIARYRPSIAARSPDGDWSVTLVEERADQYAVEQIGAVDGRLVVGGNLAVQVYTRDETGWATDGGAVRTSVHGTWAALREGAFVVGGPAPKRFKR